MALIWSYSSFKVKWYKCIGKVSKLSPMSNDEHVELYLYLYLVSGWSDRYNIYQLINIHPEIEIEYYLIFRNVYKHLYQ